MEFTIPSRIIMLRGYGDLFTHLSCSTLTLRSSHLRGSVHTRLALWHRTIVTTVFRAAWLLFRFYFPFLSKHSIWLTMKTMNVSSLERKVVIAADEAVE